MLERTTAARRELDSAAERHCWSLGHALTIGARLILSLQQQYGVVSFPAWREAILFEIPELHEASEPPRHRRTGAQIRSAEFRARLTRSHLFWLWSTLSHEPMLSDTVKFEPTRPVSILPPGSTFHFELMRSVSEEVFAVTDGPLELASGKRGRFECLPVEANLVVRWPASSEHDPEQRARAMGVAPERMRYDGAYLIIRVASLNEAYSRASELLEPRRRSHTGNVFEKALWLVDHAPPAKVPIEPWHNRPLVRLKHLREAVEIGAWPTLPVVDETPVTTER